MSDDIQNLSFPVLFNVSIEELLLSIAEYLTHDQIVELIVTMDEAYIQDWDFSKALFKRYEKIMEKYEEEASIDEC